MSSACRDLLWNRATTVCSWGSSCWGSSFSRCPITEGRYSFYPQDLREPCWAIWTWRSRNKGEKNTLLHRERLMWNTFRASKSRDVIGTRPCYTNTSVLVSTCDMLARKKNIHTHRTGRTMLWQPVYDATIVKSNQRTLTAQPQNIASQNEPEQPTGCWHNTLFLAQRCCFVGEEFGQNQTYSISKQGRFIDYVRKEQTLIRSRGHWKLSFKTRSKQARTQFNNMNIYYSPYCPY